ncbi:N-acetyldiaminopimelate deacetylase [Bombilactobacillus folatiphilus]|uniref:N-acetyldiaminopimelate deacetylase n=1 Tax=Bombilactobacillus folatiphilus TaxID=2923362 RepID=A0ABY4PAH4_9LACO|nr:N-acetyldiaminopimelate deacetylase [Bombilactobacillus folatiphilus]UQS82521.1 N-acetyldiaminopimelate deacetylase [Bombilactobacillus folatiphilus]
MFNKKEDLIQVRRHLHQIPELALQEQETASYLRQLIAQLPQDYLIVETVPKLPTAILVRVQGIKPKRTIGYRADMDALPVQESSSCQYGSQHAGVMHACGHDFHLTIALAVLAYFAQHQPVDNLVFFFQPAEESQSGAKIAYQEQAFTGAFQVDEFYALHVKDDLPVGKIGCRVGTLFAGTTEVNVDVCGVGGHAAAPQRARDVIVAAAQFVTQVQTIIARSIDPLASGVITFGKLNAGSIRNVIADHARLEGTIRGLDQAMIEQIKQRLQEIANGVANSFQVKVDVKFNQGGYLPVVNQVEITTSFIDYLQQNPQVSFVQTAPAMTGEDFGYLLSKIPGMMFWLGVQSPSGLHTAGFEPNEAALTVGVKTVIGWLKQRMEEK